QVGGEGVARVRERAPSPTDLHEEDATGSLAPCRITSFDTTYTTHSCIALLGEPPNFFACAACALQDFEAAGADFAKIGGRGTPLAHRILGLRFLRAAADRASHAERQQLYHEIWGSACNCYFGARP
ncbi:MAG: hypothetical protein FWC54_02425, partial [Actinomycetia bacterium]|nr:hypothetical protein [Actinomycetes bacterium]